MRNTWKWAYHVPRISHIVPADTFRGTFQESVLCFGGIFDARLPGCCLRVWCAGEWPESCRGTRLGLAWSIMSGRDPCAREREYVDGEKPANPGVCVLVCFGLGFFLKKTSKKPSSHSNSKTWCSEVSKTQDICGRINVTNGFSWVLRLEGPVQVPWVGTERAQCPLRATAGTGWDAPAQHGSHNSIQSSESKVPGNHRHCQWGRWGKWALLRVTSLCGSGGERGNTSEVFPREKTAVLIM